MEFTTKEFAAELNCSTRTLEGWRISRNGKSPVLPPDHYKDGRAVYTDEQLAVARARLNKSANAKTPIEKAEQADITSHPVITDSEIVSDEPKTEIAVGNQPAHDETPTAEQVSDLAEKPLSVLESEIKFHLARGTQQFIEAGRRLIAAKKIVAHGQWHQWLEKFSLKRQSAQNLMAVAERFGANYQTFGNLNYSAYVTLTALPKGEEQDFFDAQAEAGNPVDKQSASDLQKSVKAWKLKRANNPNSGEIFSDTLETNSDDSPVGVSIGEEPVTDGDHARIAAEKVISEKAAAEVQALLAEIGALIRTVDWQDIFRARRQLRAIRDELSKKNTARAAVQKG